MRASVRPAVHSDLAVVLSLARDFATSFAIEDEAFEASFSQILRDPHAIVFVAETDSGTVGYCLGFCHNTFYANGRVAWLEELMVAAEHRRLGVATQLMAEFEAWATDHGAVLVALATRRAASFYTSIGYEESASYFRKALIRTDRSG